MSVSVLPLSIGLTDAGVLSHTPGADGNLRLVGAAAKHATRMLLHWEDDVDYTVLSDGPSRILGQTDIADQHTVIDSLPAAAAAMQWLLAELDERLNSTARGPRQPLVLVLENADTLLTPSFGERAPDGSIDELRRQASLYIRRGMHLLLNNGPEVSMSVFATFAAEPKQSWPATTTLRHGLEGPTYQRIGDPVPLTWA